MPKVIFLSNMQIGAQKIQELAPPKENGGAPQTIDLFELIFTDRASGDQYRIRFQEDVRDEIIRQLCGGIVIPRGPIK